MGSASFRLWSVLVPLAAAVLCAQPALAGGFYVTEVGTPGSLGTAGVANPTNNFGPDSAWTNPAGMTGLDQDAIVSGMQLIIPWIEFDPEIAEAGGSDGGNAGVLTPAPSFFGVKVISDRLRLGIGVNGMMGGGVDYGDQFVGRYSANKAILTGIGLSPSFGYRVNDRLSLGAGLSAEECPESLMAMLRGRSDWAHLIGGSLMSTKARARPPTRAVVAATAVHRELIAVPAVPWRDAAGPRAPVLRPARR